MIKNGWKKLKQYYTKLDDSPVHALGVVLHPQMKFDYLEWAWSTKPHWILDARAAIQHFWAAKYKPVTEEPRSLDQESNESENEDEEHCWEYHVRKRARLEAGNQDDREVPDAFAVFTSEPPLKVCYDSFDLHTSY